MTDPAEIAAKLTPAQIRALRDWNPPPPTLMARVHLALKPEMVWCEQSGLVGRHDLTPLGRAVLAALDAKEST